MTSETYVKRFLCDASLHFKRLSRLNHVKISFQLERRSLRAGKDGMTTTAHDRSAMVWLSLGEDLQGPFKEGL